MSKRFTATEKWQDGWFIGLSPDHKLIWLFILDTCTNAGRWIKNFKLLNFCCETKLDDKEFKAIFNGRVLDFGDFYFIPKFLRFQYPKGLNSLKPAVQSVKNEVLRYNLYDIVREQLGNDYLIVKDKDTDKDKEKDKDKDKDKVFIDTLKANPAYKGIDIDRELGKMDAWILANPGRQKTKRFIIRWLNKVDKPVEIVKPPQDNVVDKYRKWAKEAQGGVK